MGLLRQSVRGMFFENAKEIFLAGGFSGFHAAPGCSLEGERPLYDFLVQNVCVDEYDRVVPGNPLDGGRQRDLRPGEKLHYVLCDYPREGEAPHAGARQHRYAYFFSKGNEGNKNTYSIIAGFREMTPTIRSGDYNTLGLRDIVSMVGIFPGFGCYMGAYIPKKEGYVVSVGPGYADNKVKGMMRFAHPLFPDPVPNLGSRWYASILQKTISIGRDEEVKRFPEHGKKRLFPQLTIGKRLMHVYGTRDIKTKPLDTVIVVLAFNYINKKGDAPQVNSKARQIERIYLTREFGYATRWDSWMREDNTKDVLARARKAYAYNDCGLPGDMQGSYSEHLEIGPMIEDKELGVYKYLQTVIDPETGERESKWWYMVGAHDYTDVKPQEPIDPLDIASPEGLDPAFMRLFGFSTKGGDACDER